MAAAWGCSRDCSSGAAARGGFCAGRFQDLVSAAGDTRTALHQQEADKGTQL